MKNRKIPILAHRGALLNAPENTLAAFKLAFANGADGIECDIRKTLDGRFVAFHDKTAQRVAGRDWAIAECTYGQLSNLRVYGSEPIPQLDEIFKLLLLHPSKVCYFELRLERAEDAAELAGRISKAGLAERSCVLAFSGKKELLHAARRAAPEIGTAVMPLVPNDLVGSALSAGAGAVCAGWLPGWPGSRTLFRFCAKVFDLKLQAREAMERGIEVTAGLANDYYDARWLAEQGVAGIWTDDVPMASKALRGG